MKGAADRRLSMTMPPPPFGFHTSPCITLRLARRPIYTPKKAAKDGYFRISDKLYIQDHALAMPARVVPHARHRARRAHRACMASLGEPRRRVEAPHRRLDTFSVPFEPFVVPSHLEICPCQRIPLETPAA
ncbi:hypothetical protein QZM03_21860 [Burkholderia multivorans]|nr:hypothetical protein [Burkholderia multivorans]